MLKRMDLGNPDAPVVLLQMVDDHDLEVIDSELELIRSLSRQDVYLVTIKVNDWNDDLSPWPAEPVFGKDGFGGGAERTLQFLLDEVVPEIRHGRPIYIGGYSLAGLFALWAAYRTDAFAGVAAASPSVWFPGFVDFVREEELGAEAVYLSLGDKEEKARNPVMARVGDCIREIHEHLKQEGVPATLEWNQGNHFREPDLRTAKAFAWILEELK